MNKWITGNVVQLKYWTDRLFSLIVHAPISPFTAGQFTKLGLDIDGKKVQRAYSYVNPPCNYNLEFYLISVPKGTLSPALQVLQPGNSLMLTKESAGFFVLNEIPPCENLWMLATGTAIGPYLSILEQGEGLERFKQIILVHAVRFSQDLSYLPKVLELKQRYNNKLRVQTVVSRERILGSLTGRFPKLIADGSLEEALDLRLNAENSHVMLCGNPQMVRNTQKFLMESRRMRKHFKYKPGHITSEHYW
ncbi:ferredoxin--NADP(+) reductase [Candidatus Steffania adelgidicola]|uniref:ferredoxin--NADP(+) reductase n=1 Tax=Candidatus Steffania adelgidicola TaxID=1076626 RepID=UPI001D033AB9|nr:ferredoxin--NADP(+) reductase [Candidatus Steffania adelgidicola]UDG80014.1 Flavodoxin/ferredoxin--NADP reductase [Candidatus Steffania adelgidicola]